MGRAGRCCAILHLEHLKSSAWVCGPSKSVSWKRRLVCLVKFQATGGTAWKKRGTICGRGLWSRKGRAKAFGWNEVSNPRAGWDLNHPAYDLVMFPPLGAPFEPRWLLDNAVSNVICSMVFGNRYGNEDMEFPRLLDLFNDNFHIMSSRWGEVRGSCAQSMPNPSAWIIRMGQS